MPGSERKQESTQWTGLPLTITLTYFAGLCCSDDPLTVPKVWYYRIITRIRSNKYSTSGFNLYLTIKWIRLLSVKESEIPAKLSNLYNEVIIDSGSVYCLQTPWFHPIGISFNDSHKNLEVYQPKQPFIDFLFNSKLGVELQGSSVTDKRNQ